MNVIRLSLIARIVIFRKTELLNSSDFKFYLWNWMQSLVLEYYNDQTLVSD